ncbi:amine oxidase [Eremomyces bilateralis CBS 781.70]|uniref:Amine oxidase n=1 Tax=Eremomyces bilateralis CBS 781.70 TaxID=1392243 RepID=A0A6G1G389_9PEZI|nr:amine oxidase [Eremomyces bilateralis CBS 781.70]KAF1812577.1 amine oxidase [Eremomyces bilateralis CBS 781.70]
MVAAAESVDVLVVGAGLSGLRAAVDVHRAGLSVVVLEARDRVGGKTLSVAASHLGGKVDLGAAWINDTNQSEMYKLAREFGFDLVEQRSSGFNLTKGLDGNLVKFPFNSSGPASPQDEAARDAFYGALVEHVSVANHESPHLCPDALKLDSMTFEEFARAESKSEVGVNVANRMSAALLGVDAEEVSALFMVDYIQSGTGLENMSSDLKDGGQYLRNRQGNQAFSARMAAKLPQNSLQTSTAVSKITQSGYNICEVTTTSGSTYYAKTVIVSVPTCVLPSITFDPPLPPARMSLSQNTQLGYYAKAIFIFDRPWWREAGLSGIMESDEGPISFSRDSCVEADGQYSITCFIVGDPGRRWSKWSAAERRRRVAEQFDAHFGQAARDVGVTVPAAVNIIEKEWIKDPWACGAPSAVMMPGTLTGDAGKSIREPLRNVHFVGTETALVWKGYMEGAVRSGIRGAQEVIQKLSSRTLERAKLS